MRPARLLSLAAALALAACTDPGRDPTAPVDGPSFAAAGTLTEQLRVPLAGTIADPCTGQPITFTGLVHFLYHETVTDNGVVIKGHLNVAGIKALGDDGTRYVGSQADNDMVHLNFINGSIQQTVGTTFRVTSLGSADNFMVHGLFHATLNPNGVVTAVVDRFTAVCNG